MILLSDATYWTARFLLYRGLFLTYFLAFLVAWNQFEPLAGEAGLTPFPKYLNSRSFWSCPSLLHTWKSNRAVRLVCGIGLLLSLVGLLGIEWLGSLAVGLNFLLVWVLYLSLVKAGGLFYGYGWESLLCETGILAAFLGGAHQRVPRVILVLFAWLLFRVMFGAGMIKLRGDDCWWNLTCMDYHYETQPMPNPLSWFAHRIPDVWHRLEVLGNHVVELLVPVLYFAPQPLAGLGGVLTIGFQGWLMLTGNFSWLNFLSALLALPLLPDSFFGGTLAGLRPARLAPPGNLQLAVTLGYALLVLLLSYRPARNMLSPNQVMNTGYDPLNLVNTYGAFGSITRDRYELVVQGRRGEGPWQTYEFKGKPTDPHRRPRQWAPYHLRLDWQMWFAAMRRRPPGWLRTLVDRLLENDSDITALLEENPFSDTSGPDEIRIQRYRYEFTNWEELREDGRWWNREYSGPYLPPTETNRSITDFPR